MEKGWVKLYRRILENSFLMRDNNAYVVFTRLLMIVGQDKGQWSGGRRQLAEMVNLKDSTLYKVLRRLEDNGMIALESQVRYSVISISNWHLYQNKPNGGEKRRVTDRRTLGKQGSFDELVTDEVATGEPLGNRSVTAQGHSIKNKKEEKEKESRDFDKSKMSYEEKRRYAIAVKADNEQKQRSQEAMNRGKSRTEKLGPIAERTWR